LRLREQIRSQATAKLAGGKLPALHWHMTGNLQQRLESQKQASARDPFPSLSARRKALDRLEALLRRHGEALHQAINADFGNRARPETMLAEILPVLDAIAYARTRLDRWMRPQRRTVGTRLWPGRAWILTQPLGCVGIVSPWNYPVLLSLLPLVDALAAGNRIMLKPSEQTPSCSTLLERLLAEAFEPVQVDVIIGGADVARQFCALPFDHLLFTGSTGVGRSVLQTAAAGMVPVTLELGGKSPAILCPDAVATPSVLRRTAHSLAVGKFFNAGQTCLAPDYVMTPRRHLSETAQALSVASRRLYPTIADNPDYTALISTRHHERLLALITDATPGSQSVLRHPEDRAGQQEYLRAQRRLPPTILCAPDPASRVMDEEIFGPVLPVLPYDSLQQAIEFVNARPAPLALYCYSDDRACQDFVLARTRSGGATLNGTLLHGALPSLPFGGLGQSGTGTYHGHAGFLRFSHQRSIYRPGRFSGFTWMSPPHGALTRRMLSLMLRQRP
jgi:coniferyl-aldehyde dehydrogenase